MMTIHPTHCDVSYGDAPAQTLDLYLADRDGPRPVYLYIHGGGFKRGDKAGVRQRVLALHLQNGVTVAAINYRLSDQAKAPAAMCDAARAVQFLRHHAERYNLDPARFAAGGNSAGAGISLWLAFHEDLADPLADDPVARQSTRLAAVAADDAQTSYDPRFIREAIGPPASVSDGLLRYYGMTPDQIDDPAFAPRFSECSPLAHLTADAPPVMLWYWTADVPRDRTLTSHDGIHHPEFGRILKRRMDALGIPCEIHYREQAPDPNDDQGVVAHYDPLAAAFLHRALGV